MKKKLVIILIIIISIIGLEKTSDKIPTLNLPTFQIINQKKEKPIGTLIIKKINLKQNIYNTDSIENTVEKNVTVLKESIFPPNENSIIFLAAHSGTGKIAFFQELDKLKENDTITLIYNHKKYDYKVKSIWEEKKNGYININKEIENQLILTTCSPTKDNLQLIINCTRKESIA